MLKEFKEFALKGNAIDLAVGVVIGAAFGKITNSLVNDILMPPLGLLLGEENFNNLYINLSRGEYANLTEAKTAGAATLNYGVFLNTIIEFLIIAFALFLMVKQINQLRKPAPATMKECSFCCSTVPKKATRCPQCTSTINS